MGKVLGKIGKIVGFIGLAVATIATGGAAGIGFLAAAGGAIGAATGLGVGTLALGLTLGGAGLQLLGGALQSQPQLEDTGANQRGQAFSDPNAVGAFVFGETAVPLGVVFEQNHGSSDELISTVFAHAWHRIAGYVSLHVDGELVSFSGDSATGEYAGILTWRRSVGVAAPSTALLIPGTAWPEDARGAGVAHSAMTWNFRDQDKLNGGVPNRLVVTVRGAFLYDPRQDTTVGGAGAHRYDDPSTWEWNAGNAALVALRYCIGERDDDGNLIWGVGEALDDIDMDSFIAAANVADEIRDGVPRYQLAGMFALSNNHESFFTQWEANTGGKVARIGGRRVVWLPNDDLAPIDTIAEDDLLGDAGVSTREGQEIENLVNTARGRYISPAELFQGAPYPDVEEPAAIAEDRKPRILSADFSWLQEISTAERVVRYAVRRSRFGRVWTVAVGWKGVLYPAFSVLNLSIRETDHTPQLVRVIDKRMSVTGVVVLTLQEEDPSIYDDTIPLGTPTPARPAPNRLDRLGTLSPRWGTLRDVPPELTDGRIDAALDSAGRLRTDGLAQDVQDFLRYLSERARTIEDDAKELHRLVGEMQLEDFEERRLIREELAVASTNLTAAYTNAVFAAIGPTSAIAGRIETVEAGLSDADGAISALGSGFSALTTRVDTAENAITVNTSDIASLSATLTAAGDAITANADAVSALNTRVTSAEDGITAQASQISTLTSRLSDAEAAVGGNATAIDGIDTRVQATESGVTANAASISSISSSLTGAQDAVAANASAVSSLNTRVGDAEGEVSALSQGLIGVNAATGGSAANARFGVEAATKPSDALARMALKVTATGGGGLSEAGIFLDALSGGQSRVVVDADRFVIQSGVNSRTAPFVVESGVVYIDDARIRNLSAENFVFNSNVSLGGASIGSLASSSSSAFTDIPNMGDMERVFDEDTVALILFYGLVRINNEGGDKRIITRLVDVHGSQGTRILSGQLTHNHFRAQSSANEESMAFGFVVAEMRAGQHMLSVQWQVLGGGTATISARKLAILAVKKSSFSGLTGSPSNSGGGGGIGGGGWGGGLQP